MVANSGVTLECTIALGPDGLKLSYTVRNGTAGEIGLLNRIPLLAPDGKASFPPEILYIDLKETTIHLKKMILPVPEGLRMAARPVPAVTRLAPGAVFQEELTVAVPVLVNNPLRRAAMVGESGGRPVAVDLLRRGDAAKFSLGFFLVEPAMRFDPAAPEVFTVYPPPVDRQRILVEALSMPAPVAVFDYRVVAPEESPEPAKKD